MLASTKYTLENQQVHKKWFPFQIPPPVLYCKATVFLHEFC